MGQHDGSRVIGPLAFTAAVLLAMTGCASDDATDTAPPTATGSTSVGTPVAPNVASVDDGAGEAANDVALAFSSPLNDTVWRGSMVGLVALGEPRGSEPGTCVAVLVTLEAIESAVDAPNYLSAPPVSLQTDAALELRGAANCDDDGVSRAGYSLIDVAVFPVGVSVPVFYPFVVAPGETVESIVVGNPRASAVDWDYFDATPLAEVPPAGS